MARPKRDRSEHHCVLLNVYVTPAAAEQTREAAQRRHTTVSELLRGLLREHLRAEAVADQRRSRRQAAVAS